MSDITELLGKMQAGDRAASDTHFTALYTELRRMARRQFGGEAAPRNATSLVHEAYCKPVAAKQVSFYDRKHFHASLATLAGRRFDAGLELSETTALLESSESSLKRDWQPLPALLYQRIGAA